MMKLNFMLWGLLIMVCRFTYALSMEQKTQRRHFRKHDQEQRYLLIMPFTQESRTVLMPA